MSRRNGRRMDLKLNLSLPSRTTNQQRFNSSPSRSPSPPSSCVSSDDMIQDEQMLAYSASPEATSMVLVGCPRCLMYVMLIAEDDPKCPKCKSTVLLEFMNNGNNDDDASSGNKPAAGTTASEG
ncbi:unnamed protein product [Rhodiola kirilowii]